MAIQLSLFAGEARLILKTNLPFCGQFGDNTHMNESDDQTQNLLPPRLDGSTGEFVHELNSTPTDEPTRDFVPVVNASARTLTGDFVHGRPTPTDPINETIRQSVPGYQIERELGRGGMGVVYLATQLDLNRRVALKMILSGEHASRDEKDRFLTEAKAVASLQHPGIVQIHEIGEADGRPYLAFEYIGGGNLAAALDGLPWPAKPAARVTEALARTMHFAHSRGIVHRDLKPANILLNEKVAKASDADPSTLKLTDFGLAKRVERDSDWSNSVGFTPVGGLTRTGAVVGTPSYIAPEQAAGKNRDIGPAVDTYALGAILYEFLTGRPPFRGETPLDTVLQVMADDPVAPSKLRAKCPRDLETICLKCLQKDPRKRYASAGDLADDLRRFLNDEPISARPVGRRERMWKWIRRHPAATVLTITSSLAVFSLLVLSIYFNIQLREAANREVLRANDAIEAENKAINEQRQAERDRIEAQRQKLIADAARLEAEKKRREAERGVYALQLFKAAALTDRDPQRALRMLEDVRRCPEELRDFTWRMLKAQCRVSEVQVGWHRRDRQDHPVTRVIHSPDGKFVASSSWDGTARVWDIAKKQLLFVLAGHQNTVTSVTFSADSRTIATCGDDNTVQLWELPTHIPNKPEVLQPFAVLKGHTDSVKAIAFDPTGEVLASAGIDGVLRVWHVPSRELNRDRAKPHLLHALTEHIGAVRTLAWSLSGLFTGGQDGVVRQWEVDAEKPSSIVVTKLSSPIKSMAASNEGEFIAIASDADDSAIHLYRLHVMKEVGRLRGHTGDINGLSFSPDDKRLASCGQDGSVRLWDCAELRERAVFRPRSRRDMLPIPVPEDRPIDPEKQVTTVSFAIDGNSIVSSGLDGVIRQWDFTSQREESCILDAKAPFATAAMSGDGQTFACVGKDNLLKVWKLPTTGVTYSPSADRILRGLEAPARSVAISHDGSIIAVASDDDKVLYWRLTDADPKPVRLLDLRGVSLAIHSKRMAIVTELGQLRWFDFRTNKLSNSVLSVSGRPSLARFSSDGNKLVTAGTRFLQIWNAELGTLEGQVTIPQLFRVTALTVMPGSTQESWSLATADFRGQIDIWDVVPDTSKSDLPDVLRLPLQIKSRASMNIINDPVRTMHFTQDGRTLVTGGADRVVRLWDPETGQERAALPNHSDSVMLVHFRTDTTLITLGRDGSMRIWNGPR